MGNRCRWPRRVVCLLLPLLLFLGSACKARPNEEECLQALENTIRLRARGRLTDEQVRSLSRTTLSRQMARKICVEERSRDSVRCEMEAGSLEELARCQTL